MLVQLGRESNLRRQYRGRKPSSRQEMQETYNQMSEEDALGAPLLDSTTLTHRELLHTTPGRGCRIPGATVSTRRSSPSNVPSISAHVPASVRYGGNCLLLST